MHNSDFRKFNGTSTTKQMKESYSLNIKVEKVDFDRLNKFCYGTSEGPRTFISRSKLIRILLSSFFKSGIDLISLNSSEEIEEFLVKKLKGEKNE